MILTSCGNSNETAKTSVGSAAKAQGADEGSSVQLAQTSSNSESSGDEKGWYTNWNAGLAQAKKEGKPVIVDFYAEWCKWCKVMDEKTFSAPEIKKMFAADWVTIRIDTEDSNSKGTFKDKTMSYRELAGAFKVKGLPSFLFIAKDGEPVKVIPGYIEKDEFRLLLDYFKDEIYKKITFPEYKKSRS